MRDDNVREHHGCTCFNGNVYLIERPDGIKINAEFNSILKPRHARYLARKLYHLARKIERRDAAAMSAGTAKTEGLGAQPASAVPTAAAPTSDPTSATQEDN